MEAAGYKDAVDMEFTMHSGAEYGTRYSDTGPLIVDQLNKSGLFKVKTNRPTYSDFLPNIYNKRDYKGVAYQEEFVYAEVDGDLFNWYHSKGSRFKWGFPGQTGDPKLDDMIMQQRREMDDKKRTAIIADIQKYMALSMMMVPGDGVSSGFTFQWPALRNTAWPGYLQYVDTDQPPFKTA